MCVSVCMFVATTSINKNCLYSFSLPLSLYCALSTCCSLLLRDAHAQKQAASRDSLYVQYAEPANIAAYFLPSLRPLFAAAFDVCCVSASLCSLLRSTFSPLRGPCWLWVGGVTTGALRQTSRVLRFTRMPQAHPSMFQLRHWPNCCPIDDVIADADRGVCRRHIQRLFLAALGFFPALHLHN